MKTKMFRRMCHLERHSFRPAVGVVVFMMIVSLLLQAFPANGAEKDWSTKQITCLLYTSDAADE